ncbi:MAG TPA: ferric reductase-like transmembrane domain-containing protein [Rhodocyclaceae bacterium]|nr:ferric reductase-like transmembrane domain-containing protein [Rhodocyclaceae bacterium]
MKNAKQAFWGCLIVLSLLWWGVDSTDWAQVNGVFAWRTVLSQYTGILGIGVMSVGMILAMRPAFLERHFDGLDKMYRLHKWLGIAGLVISIGHWLIAKGPKWMVAAGWLERGARKPRPALPEGSLQQLLAQQRGLAESIGEWAFYLAVVLIVLALIKRFPYRRFFQTHRILALAYLALVFHAVVLLRFEYWSSPLGVVLGMLMAAGSVAAVMSLFRLRVGSSRVAGRVVALEHQPALNVLAVDIELADGWQGHESGQFAFVTFHPEEGPHPFTIASNWNGDGRIRFLVKGLGDYTRILPDRLRVGDPVKVEGPHGRFDFAGDAPRQIWIGGGIGITPFVARLKELAQRPDGKAIDLFHTTAAYDQEIIDRLARDADAANVRLHVRWDERDGRLDLDSLVAAVPDWRQADVWFCGPAQFGRVLREGLVRLGLPAGRFHQELFEMR